MSKTEKAFDAVAMMRSARDRISAAIEGMTLAEELKWLASREIKDPFFKVSARESCQIKQTASRAAFCRSLCIAS